MACECKDNDGKAAERGNRACPVYHANRTPISGCVSDHEVVDNQDNQVCHRDECCNTRIFERVQASEVGEGNGNQPDKVEHISMVPILVPVGRRT